MSTSTRLQAIADAAHRGDLPGLRAALSAGPIDLNTHIDGLPILMFAAAGGSVEAVAEMLRCGADVNLAATDGSTALMTAVLWNHAPIVYVLLQQGADPGIADRDGWTALYIARARGYGTIARLLMTYGATG